MEFNRMFLANFDNMAFYVYNHTHNRGRRARKAPRKIHSNNRRLFLERQAAAASKYKPCQEEEELTRHGSIIARAGPERGLTPVLTLRRSLTTIQMQLPCGIRPVAWQGAQAAWHHLQLAELV